MSEDWKAKAGYKAMSSDEIAAMFLEYIDGYEKHLVGTRAWDPELYVMKSEEDTYWERVANVLLVVSVVFIMVIVFLEVVL